VTGAKQQLFVLWNKRIDRLLDDALERATDVCTSSVLAVKLKFVSLTLGI
jgi:TolB-like protein